MTGVKSKSFEAFQLPVNVREFEYTAESLLPGVLAALSKRRLRTEGNDLLLAGVAGRKRLFAERTHGDRFATFGIPLSTLERGVARGQVTWQEDPFFYAGDASYKAPALVVYDLNGLQGIGKNDFTEKYKDTYGDLPDINQYGVGEGNLDPVTIAAILLKPVGLS